MLQYILEPRQITMITRLVENFFLLKHEQQFESGLPTLFSQIERRKRDVSENCRLNFNGSPSLMYLTQAGLLMIS